MEKKNRKIIPMLKVNTAQINSESVSGSTRLLVNCKLKASF